MTHIVCQLNIIHLNNKLNYICIKKDFNIIRKFNIKLFILLINMCFNTINLFEFISLDKDLYNVLTFHKSLSINSLLLIKFIIQQVHLYKYDKSSLRIKETKLRKLVKKIYRNKKSSLSNIILTNLLKIQLISLSKAWYVNLMTKIKNSINFYETKINYIHSSFGLGLSTIFNRWYKVIKNNLDHIKVIISQIDEKIFYPFRPINIKLCGC